MAGGHVWQRGMHGRGCAWLVGCAWLGGMHGWGVHGRGACMVGGVHGRGACVAGGHTWLGGGCVWQGGMHGWGAGVAGGHACHACSPRHYEIRLVNARAVCSLLECILVM